MNNYPDVGPLSDAVHDLDQKAALLEALIESANLVEAAKPSQARQAAATAMAARAAIRLLVVADQVLRLGRPRYSRISATAEILLSSVTAQDYRVAGALLTDLLAGLQGQIQRTADELERGPLFRHAELVSGAREDITRLQALARKATPLPDRPVSSPKPPVSAVSPSYF